MRKDYAEVVEVLRPFIQAANGQLEFLKQGSWTSLVDNVKRCFRSSPETAEAGCSDHLANTLFAGLRAQAQGDFLRT
jgi:hypothetical protein